MFISDSRAHGQMITWADYAREHKPAGFAGGSHQSVEGTKNKFQG